MTTKTRYFVILSLSILTVGVGTGLTAYYVGFPAGAVSGSAADELRLVSSKAAVVAYADVQKVMTSELRQRLRRALPAQENGQREFQNLTGINIETDITHVIAFIEPDTASGGSVPGAGMVLASGLFDEVKIESLMREHGATVETYKDKRLIVASPNGGRPAPDANGAPAAGLTPATSRARARVPEAGAGGGGQRQSDPAIRRSASMAAKISPTTPRS